MYVAPWYSHAVGDLLCGHPLRNFNIWLLALKIDIPFMRNVLTNLVFVPSSVRIRSPYGTDRRTGKAKYRWSSGTCYSSSYMSTWPEVLYNLGSGSWSAWANDTAAHYAAISERLHPRFAASIHTTAPIIHTRPSPVVRKLLLISLPAEGKTRIGTVLWVSNFVRGVDPYGTGGHVPQYLDWGTLSRMPPNISRVISATFYPCNIFLISWKSF